LPVSRYVHLTIDQPTSQRHRSTITANNSIDVLVDINSNCQETDMLLYTVANEAKAFENTCAIGRQKPLKCHKII